MRYFYSKEFLEQQADKINKKYYPERLEKVIPFDPYDFLEKLGLDVEWKYISPDDSFLGMFFFEDGAEYVWPKGSYTPGDMPHKELFRKNTVVINQILLDKKSNANRERFVCNHEICHSIKDREYFADHPKEILRICGSDSMNKTYWDNSMSEEDMIERQTNYLNAAILIPKDVVKREFFKLCRYKNIPDGPIDYTDYMKKHISKIAKGYGLNFNVILYRLKDLNIIRTEK